MQMVACPCFLKYAYMRLQGHNSRSESKKVKAGQRQSIWSNMV